jgi:23S rRNA (uracil1939-C5)-methyltransferase
MGLGLLDLDVKKFENKADRTTYDEIKAYVEEKYEFKVSSLYISQIKDKVGIKERKNYIVVSDEGRVPAFPSDKEEAIMGVFKYFGLI